MTLPQTMRAIAISKPGGPDVLLKETRPVPRPKAGEVLIKLAAIGVNRPDALQRAGLYPPPKGASDLPGLEGAGEIVALGEGVTQWKIGDQVCALFPGGAYAEYALTDQGQVLPVPQGLSMAEAAALPETYFTVWSNVFDRGQLKSGERLLVHGGSSGIGTTAIQLAKAFGAEVFTTAGSAAKCKACADLGADFAINYREGDWFEALQAQTGGEGVNVILDMVGAPYLQKNLTSLADDGRLVFIAFLQGMKAEINFRDVLTRRLTITGSTLRPRSNAFKAEIAKNLKDKVWPLLEAGRVKPVMDQSFDLEEAFKAHERMESSAHIGKITLTV